MRDNWKAVFWFCVASILWIGGVYYMDYKQKQQRMQVYQDCMTDIHNVYGCTVYANQYNKYVP